MFKHIQWRKTKQFLHPKFSTYVNFFTGYVDHAVHAGLGFIFSLPCIFIFNLICCFTVVSRYDSWIRCWTIPQPWLILLIQIPTSGTSVHPLKAAGSHITKSTCRTPTKNHNLQSDWISNKDNFIFQCTRYSWTPIWTRFANLFAFDSWFLQVKQPKFLIQGGSKYLFK